MNAAAVPFERARRELIAARHVPYTALVAPEVVRTLSGDYVQTIRIGGIAFESADDEAVNAWHERLNALWRNVASAHVALWVHIVRRRDRAYPAGEFPPGFARELNERYRARLAGETLMVNELYVSLVYRPQPTAVGSAALKLFGRAESDTARAELAESLEACEKLRSQVLAGLAAYEPEVLGLRAGEGAGPRRSALLEFLGLLVNGERQAWALPTAPVADVLATSRLLFGTEAMEYRTPSESRLAAFIGIKEYPTPTSPGVLNRLLTAPFPFVLTQSFAFLPKSTAQGLLSRQYHRMTNAGDLAVSQAEALKAALDQLSGNEFVMGDHHLTLQVLTEAVEAEDTSQGEASIRALNESVALARTWLGETGMVVAREDLAMEAAFWAQLPGNFGFRPRKAPITSRNFAGLCPLHNFPGRPRDRQSLGRGARAVCDLGALALLLLVARERSSRGGRGFAAGHRAYVHLRTDGLGEDRVPWVLCGHARESRRHSSHLRQRSRARDPGAGIGRRVRAAQVRAADRFQSARLARLSPAAGISAGVAARAGRASWTERSRCVRRRISSRRSWERWRWSRRLPGGCRGSSSSWIPRTRRACTRASRVGVPRADGEYAWVFDGAETRGEEWLAHGAVVGFDVTEFLESPAIRTPITLYLFHRVRQTLDGRRLVVWMDEFAKLLGDPAFEGFARDGLKTWRKLNAVAAFATQSPSDVLASPIARTLVEQTPTKVLFPNLEAQRDEYVDGFGLSEREFELIGRELTPGSRRFLVRQGMQGVVCELNLRGFEYELAVISGRTENVQRMERLAAECGVDPALWLPRFRDEVEAKR